MITVGAFEAKTHLSSLLEQVALGQEVLITRHGKPVARLVPAGGQNQDSVDMAVARFKEIRAGVTLGGLDWKALRDEGRR